MGTSGHKTGVQGLPSVFFPRLSSKKVGPPPESAAPGALRPGGFGATHLKRWYAPGPLGPQNFFHRMEIPYVFHRNLPNGVCTSPSGLTPSAPLPWGFGSSGGPGGDCGGVRRGPFYRAHASKAPPPGSAQDIARGDRRHRRPDERLLHHQGVHLLMPGCWTSTWPRPRTSPDMVYHLPSPSPRWRPSGGHPGGDRTCTRTPPDDLCAEKLFGAVFQGSPWARPILGCRRPWPP